MSKDLGVPPKIICDGAQEQVQDSANRICQLFSCIVVEIKQGMQQTNWAEGVVKQTKNGVKSDMVTSGSAAVFWDYGAE